MKLQKSELSDPHVGKQIIQRIDAEICEKPKANNVLEELEIPCG
jgi:hypothetical protein